MANWRHWEDGLGWGRKWGWGPEGDSSGGGSRHSGCGCNGLTGLRCASPHVCSCLGAGVPSPPTLRKQRRGLPGLGDRQFPSPLPRGEFLRGRVLNHRIPGRFLGRGGRASLSGPPDASSPIGEADPGPPRAASARSREPKSPALGPPRARAEAAASTSLPGSRP